MNNEDYEVSESQRAQIKSYLLAGFSITQREASREPFNCWRLSSVIHRLRNEGLEIITERPEAENGKSYARYRVDFSKMDTQLSMNLN